MSLSLLLKVILHRKIVTTLLLVQLAITLALLLNSILLANQTHQQLNQPTGLELENTLLVQLKPTTPQLRQHPALEDLMQRQIDALQNIPNVVAASYSNQALLTQGGSNGNLYDVEREDTSNIESVPIYTTSPEFFDVLNVEVLQGELPSYSDAPDENGHVGIVLTESLAKALFPEQTSFVGLQLNRGPVRAVVSDFYGQRKRSPGNETLNSIQVIPPESVDWGYTLILRTTQGQANSVREQLTGTLQQVEPNIEVYYIRTLAEQQRELYSNEYGLASLLAILTALMLLVTMISSYSSTHFHVLKRNQEIGVKRALGASKGLIFLELLSEGWICTLAGAILGVGCALILNQSLSQVISLPSLNWWLPLVTSAILLLSVTLATWYPAAIAIRVSPATATKAL
ncbi:MULTISPECIES: FtsX-like permease family protein [Gammaproteobacteria]|uniref:FtsX-like permease family protein n=1 Tax=Gammaproteobacteria TaxID=1236 RepID=UPI000DD0601A|nr:MULTISPECIES: FtsX-like permease family protein [Gammaproteobacteria]RTE86718.1 FtsX-like permease family protein [Aliidiomarina sp. B3213]TCZ90728.1 FtsX-like permease family protein [Lysobacter sp. N42]